MEFDDFDPQQHEGEQLYELRTEDVDGTLLTTAVAVDVPFEQAAETPWYYVVEVKE